MRPDVKVQKKQMRQSPAVRSKRVRIKYRSQMPVKSIRAMEMIDDEVAGFEGNIQTG